MPGPRRAAVLGSPVAHSLSPALHRAAYAALGLDGWVYDAVEVDEAGLAAFLGGLGPEWAGLSLTMPLKRAVRPLLAAESPLAAAVGAVNTVTFPPGGPVGDNTDVAGIVEALRETGAAEASRARVLGGGATAASTVAALAGLGCADPVVHVRSPARAGDLLEAAGRLGVRVRLEPLDPADLARALAGGEDDVVVSTLPPGAAGPLAAALAAVLGAAGPAPAPGRRAAGPELLDVVYAPWPTDLAEVWGAAGRPVAGGFVMLLHQAAAQVRLMTGLEPPVAVMRAAGEAELARRAAPSVPSS